MMTFCEKIRNILKDNDFKITSASKLEDFVDLGRSSITAHYTKKGPCPDTEPGLAVQNAIKEKLRINKEWWENGRGPIYSHNNQHQESQPKTSKEVKVLPLDAWELIQDDNKEFKKEISNLWDMIRYLKSQGIKSHE